MDDVGSERASLLGWAETSNTCSVFAATYPERVERLIFYVPYVLEELGERELKGVPGSWRLLRVVA